MKKRLLSGFLALCMVVGLVAVLPVTASAVDANNDGYHDGDIAAIQTIIAAHPETGLSQWAGNVPPEDWDWWSDSNHRVQWTDSTPKRIKFLSLTGLKMEGLLDVTELTALEYLKCGNNKLSGLNVSGLSALRSLDCSENRIPSQAAITGLSESLANDSLNFNFSLQYEQSVPTQAHNYSFSGTQYGAANDGVDFNALGNGQIYMGIYDHIAAFPNAITAASASTLGTPVKEGVSRPILWRVMGEESNDGSLTVMSKYVLDGQPYLNSNNYVSSGLRAWLNGTFQNTAFLPTEAQSFFATTVAVDGYRYAHGRVNDVNTRKTIRGDKVYIEAPGYIWAAFDTTNPQYMEGEEYSSSGFFTNPESTNVMRNGRATCSTGYGNVDVDGDGVIDSETKWKQGILVWGRGYIVDEKGHAMRTDYAGGANEVSSIFGVRPLVKLDPKSVILASEISDAPLAHQTAADDVNYGTGNNPFATEALTGGFGEYDIYARKNYKLTLVNDSIKMTALSYGASTLTNGASVSVSPGGAIAMSASASGHDVLAYKIVENTGNGRIIAGYGTGSSAALSVTAKDLSGQSLKEGGDYTLYVWAQKNNAINSNEGSVPMYFKLNIGPDVPSSWATEQVSAAIAAGLVPDALQSKYTMVTTRAEFCALAVALYETATGAEITERATFSDTIDINVQKMAGLEVVNGVGEGKFAPDSKLTREQAATMLSRLAEAIGKPIDAQPPTFKDNASVSSWAFDAVGQMQASGIMGGVGDNTFSPGADYTREQSIVTLLRLYEHVTQG